MYHSKLWPVSTFTPLPFSSFLAALSLVCLAGYKEDHTLAREKKATEEIKVTSRSTSANWVNQLQPLYIAGTVLAGSRICYTQ